MARKSRAKPKTEKKGTARPAKHETRLGDHTVARARPGVKAGKKTAAPRASPAKRGAAHLGVPDMGGTL